MIRKIKREPKAQAASPLSPKKMAEYQKHAAIAAQAAVIRLKVSAEEDAAKKAMLEILAEAKLTKLNTVVTVHGSPITVQAEQTTTQRRSLNTAKFIEVAGEEAFRNAATITLSAAEQILPSALVDKCVTVESSKSMKLTFGKGCPAPSVKFF